MITASDTAGPAVGPDTDAVLSARGLVKRYGNVTAIRGSDFDLFPGEVLAIVGDTGAGKSSLIKALTGALIPDAGTITLNGEEIRFGSPADARNRGIETVYQTLAVSPALDIATNLFLGREIRRRGLLGRLHVLDRNAMRTQAKEQLDALGIATVQDITQPVESLSGGQRQAVAVARAAMLVAQLGPRPDDVRRSGQRSELTAARDVVVVEMRLDDVGDPEIGLAGRIEVDVHVPARVHDRGRAARLVGDERRQVPQPLDPERPNQHRPTSSRGRHPPRAPAR